MQPKLTPAVLIAVSNLFIDQLENPTTTTLKACDITNLPESIVLGTLALFERFHLITQEDNLWILNGDNIMLFCRITESETAAQDFIDNPERETSPVRFAYETLLKCDPNKPIFPEMIVMGSVNLNQHKAELLFNVLEKSGIIQLVSDNRWTIIQLDKIRELATEFKNKSDQELRENPTSLYDVFRRLDNNLPLLQHSDDTPPSKKGPLPRPHGIAPKTQSLAEDNPRIAIKQFRRERADARRKDRSIHVRLPEKASLKFEILCLQKGLTVSEVVRSLIKSFILNNNVK